MNRIIQVPSIKPWEYDFYMATFDHAITDQELLDHSVAVIPNYTNMFSRILGDTVYFIVPKGTIIPEDFSFKIENITDVPEETLQGSPE